MSEMKYSKLTEMILASTVKVHGAVDVGLLKSVYEYCLVEELKHNGLYVHREVKLPFLIREEILKRISTFMFQS